MGRFGPLALPTPPSVRRGTEPRTQGRALLAGGDRRGGGLLVSAHPNESPRDRPRS